MTTFKKIADFDVARFMGGRSKLGKYFDGFWRDLFVGHNNAFPDEVMCGAFDWNGETIWTPCGYEHAFNTWSRIGQFVAHVKSDEAGQQETQYAYRCGDARGNNIIFGDNRILWCATSYKNVDVQSIYKAKENSTFDARHLTVTRDGSVVFTDGQMLNILARSDTGTAEFLTHKIPLDKGINWFKLLENDLDSDFSYIAVCTAKRTATALDEPNRITLISLKNNSVFNRVEVNGTQTFSRHPKKEEMVVLGQKLTVLSLPDLKTVNAIELPLMGKERNMNPAHSRVEHSPNGQYFALAYTAKGDVEIRDTHSLEIIQTFDGQGRLLTDMSWNSTGEYLACGFRDRNGREKIELIVWDMKSHKTVFRISTGNKKVDAFPTVVYRWSPLAAELACLVDNQRIQIFGLR